MCFGHLSLQICTAKRACFRNRAHVFRAKARVRKPNEADDVVCRNDVQNTSLEPLGSGGL